MPKQPSSQQQRRPQRPASWPDYAPDPPKGRPKQSNPWPAVVAIMLAFGLVVGGGVAFGIKWMTDRQVAPVNPSTDVSGEVANAPKQAEGTVGGKAVRDGDVAFKVTKVSVGANTTAIRLAVRNDGEQPVSLTPALQYVLDREGRSYPSATLPTDSPAQRFLAPLAPGEARAGFLFFPVGKAQGPTAVVLRGGASPGLKVTF